ncbi:YqaI family protein [Pseudobacillus wudalianchiensis]|uniref:Uncharacterized protein n=1 Tax=Pseudobacillus wudalianchiensis TaxID=1743143 RepID=A0A1B9AU61_9BACI|nr:hypothetical protein [Bacillus wudalianchiensis]OCA87324.1 hypothetical protein A8F95_08750 [Bacillus wudalianchiensis]
MNIEHPAITQTMETGYANMVSQPEHCGIDAMGDEILIGDSIIEIGGEIVLEENLEDYLIEYLGAQYKTAE